MLANEARLFQCVAGSPVTAKLARKACQVGGGRLAHAVNRILRARQGGAGRMVGTRRAAATPARLRGHLQPRGTLGPQLLLHGVETHLAGHRRHVLDDGKPDPPVAVGRKLLHRRQQALRKQLHPHHLRPQQTGARLARSPPARPHIPSRCRLAWFTTSRLPSTLSRTSGTSSLSSASITGSRCCTVPACAATPRVASSGGRGGGRAGCVREASAVAPCRSQAQQT